MIDLSKFAGSYTEFVRWRDTSGRSGELRGSIVVSLERDQISLHLDDGHLMTGELTGIAAEPIRLVGSLGGTTSSGLLYVGDDTLVLEYEADVRGQIEHTLDAWRLDAGSRTILRVGLIHQPEVTIWFEGRMQPD